MAKPEVAAEQQELKGMRPEFAKELEKADKKARRLQGEAHEAKKAFEEADLELLTLIEKHQDKLRTEDGKIKYGNTEYIPGKAKLRYREPLEGEKKRKSTADTVSETEDEAA